MNRGSRNVGFHSGTTVTKWQFSPSLLYTLVLELVKPLLFNIPEAWKKYSSFRAAPLPSYRPLQGVPPGLSSVSSDVHWQNNLSPPVLDPFSVLRFCGAQKVPISVKASPYIGHYKEYAPPPPLRGAACPVLVVFTGKTIFHCTCWTIFIDTILWHASLASITVEDPLRAQKLVHVHLH